MPAVALAIVWCLAAASALASHDDLPPRRGGPSAAIGARASVAVVVDGILDAAEWADAHRFDVSDTATLATLYVKNDFDALYLAVAVQTPSTQTGQSLLVVFDDGRDPQATSGSDALGVVVGQGFEDLFQTQRDAAGAALLVPGVGAWMADTSAQGTRDGTGAGRTDGAGVVFEIAHPLASNDAERDLQLEVGDTVSFALRYHETGRTARLEWPVAVTDQEGYATLAATGDLAEAAFTRLEARLQAAPSALFTANLKSSQLSKAPLRRQNLLARLAVARQRYRDGDVRGAYKKIAGRAPKASDPPEKQAKSGGILRRVESGSSQTWLQHNDPEASTIENGVLYLGATNAPALTGCDSAGPGVMDGMRHFLFTSFEGIVSGWTATGAWHLASSVELSGLSDATATQDMAGCQSGSQCYYFGVRGALTYDQQVSLGGGVFTSVAHSGELTSPEFFVPRGTQAILSFGSAEQTEDRFVTWDAKRVLYSTDGGGTWEPAPIYQGQGPAKWATPIADLRGATGCLRVKFVFDTVDAENNAFAGWIVDNVRVFGTRADVDWLPLDVLGRTFLPDVNVSPVLVGDEQPADGILPGRGRLYAFTIDLRGRGFLTAHDMHAGWSTWTPFPGDARLVAGSASAVGHGGRVMIVARGEDGLPYASAFRTEHVRFPRLVAFEPIGDLAIEGRPAVAASDLRFHVVAVHDRGDALELLHMQTTSPTGEWGDPVVIRDAAPISHRDPAATTDPATGRLHVLWVGDLGSVWHSAKRDPGLFEAPRFTEVVFALSSPSVAFWGGLVHLAVQLPNNLVYTHNDSVDDSWSPDLRSVELDGDDTPRVVDHLAGPIIFTRGFAGQVRAFRPDLNVPDEPLVDDAWLAAPLFFSNTPVEAVRSFGELYVAGHDDDVNGGSYIMASRALAGSIYTVVGLDVDTTTPYCDDSLGSGYPLRAGDAPVNAAGACPGERLAYPLAPPTVGGDPARFVAYTRLAELVSTFPWSVARSDDAFRDLAARLGGVDVIGKGGSSDFWMGYLDVGGFLDSNLGPKARFLRTRTGLMADEFTHPAFPLAAHPTAVFVDENADHLFCGGALYPAACPLPGGYAYAANYARTSVDHDFIETWKQYRLGNGNALRTRVRDGFCCGVAALFAKYLYLRYDIHQGREFHAGSPCTALLCPPAAPCPVGDELDELCGR